MPPRYRPKALLRRRSKPFLIWAAPPFLATHGLTFAAFATLGALQGSSGSILIADRPIPYIWYAGVVYPLYLLGAAMSMTAAYGLLTERLWVRSLLTRWAAALFIATTIVCSSLTGLGLHVLIVDTWWGWALLGMSFWYFYRYAPVRRYYDRVSQGSPARLQT